MNFHTNEAKKGHYLRQKNNNKKNHRGSNSQAKHLQLGITAYI